jgi:hypothetical protein
MIVLCDFFFGGGCALQNETNENIHRHEFPPVYYMDMDDLLLYGKR